MPEENTDSQLAKARAFWESAREAARADNFDYAIDMYLEGLRCAPDEVREGHLPVCELGIRRIEAGGRRASMVERAKRLRGKNPLEQLLNAEYLFVKDPDNLDYAEAMLKAAVAGDYGKTADWLANLLFQANSAEVKPSAERYLFLKDCYLSIDQLDKAVIAAQRAFMLRPHDKELAEMVKNLTAEFTVRRGRYNDADDFRESIKDRDFQEKLQSQASVVKTQEHLSWAIDRARQSLSRDPEKTQNILNLAQALSDVHKEREENEAIQLLEEAYASKGDFIFKDRANQIRMQQIRRKIRQAAAAVEANPEDKQSQSNLAELTEQLKTTELEHYRICVENYPTDLRAKYEYGMRLLENGQYDEAIPMFQEAQRDPQHRVSAMNKAGMCFFMKGWFTDAVDIFDRAIKMYELEDDDTGKELRYNLGRAYEEQAETEKALEVYRRIVQVDFGYKDVSTRVEKLRDDRKS